MTQSPIPPTTPGPVSGPPKTSGKAIGSLICGIIGLFFCGLILGLIAISLANNAKKDIAVSGGAIGGQGLATAGFVLGIIGVVGWAIIVVMQLTSAFG